MQQVLLTFLFHYVGAGSPELSVLTAIFGPPGVDTRKLPSIKLCVHDKIVIDTVNVIYGCAFQGLPGF
jgi:hypothetical protein